MTTVIEHSHKDHANLARLLNLVGEEIDEAKQDGKRGFFVLEHVMRYITSYLDQAHHHKEDAIFRRVASLDPLAISAIDELTLEHEKLTSAGRELYDLVYAAQNSDFVRREDVISKGTDYVKTLRAHFSKEIDLLSRARWLLSEQDLREIDAEVESINDPLFGDTVEKEYQSLYAYIMAQQEES